MYVADDDYLKGSVVYKVIDKITSVWRNDNRVLPWLKEIVLPEDSKLYQKFRYASFYAVQAIAHNYSDEPKIDSWLKNNALNSDDDWVKASVLRGLASAWRDDPNTVALIKEYAQLTEMPNVQQEALKLLFERWKEDSDTLKLLSTFAESSTAFFGVRSEAIEMLAKGWHDESWLFDFLLHRAMNDPFIREHTSNRNPRLKALGALLTYYPTHLKTIALLHDRAINDPDQQLREWAHQQLEKLEKS